MVLYGHVYVDMVFKQMYPVVLSERTGVTFCSQIGGLNKKSVVKVQNRPKARGAELYLAKFSNLKTHHICAVGTDRNTFVSRLNRLACMLGNNEDSFSATNGSEQEDPNKHVERIGDTTVASETETHQKAQQQLNSLDSYFSNLQGKAHNVEDGARNSNEIPSTDNIAAAQQESLDESDLERLSTNRKAGESPKDTSETKLASELDALDGYFRKLNPDAEEYGRNVTSKTTGDDNTKSNLTDEEALAQELSKLLKILTLKLENTKQYKTSEQFDGNEDPVDQLVSANGDPYNAYLINCLAAINIAVYLFELASPVKTSEVEILSLPLLYGAKINELILNGEWWRLITPMFLHQGFLHVAFSTWALLTFGPLVDKAYGSIAFCMIFFLGGLCGNVMSFFHGPNATVGGTGPILAIIGSWVAYLFQNRETFGDEITAIMMQRVTLASLLSVALSVLLPIDDWTHLGAVCVGVTFGFLVCPVLPVDMHSKRSMNGVDTSQEQILSFNRQPELRRLLAIFFVFIAILTVLFYALAPIVTAIHVSSARDTF